MEDVMEYECGVVKNEAWTKENEEKVVIMVLVEEIMPNRAQPRRVFDNAELEELAFSIREYGLIQPIVVRKCDELVGSVFRYELIAGERRLRAAKMVGITKIPCVLLEVDEKESAELAIVENLHRKDLNIFEIAEAISALVEIYGLTQDEVAKRLSITQSAVANKLRLLRLSDVERGLIMANNLTERHARALLRVGGECERLEVLGKIIADNMNVRCAEDYIEAYLECDEGINVDKNVGLSGNFAIKCTNVIQKAIDKLRKAGCETKSTCTETDGFYIYTITVEKN